MSGHEFWYLRQGCPETFVSDAAFDAHRVGVFEERRCLTVAEMEAQGWEKTLRGWRHPKGIRERQKAQRRPATGSPGGRHSKTSPTTRSA